MVPTGFDKPARFDFRTGIPDATLFPYQSWRRLLARQLRPAAVGSGAYGDPAGHPGLRRPSPATSAWPAACRPAPRWSW